MAAPHDHIVVARDVGPHRILLEFPDLVHVHYGGDVELAHFLAFDEVMLAIPPPTPLYLLRDARNGGLIAAKTRKHIVTRPGTSRFLAVATYGSSFQSKVVFANMNRALRAVRFTPVPSNFFDTEAEARSWLAEQRRQQQEAT